MAEFRLMENGLWKTGTDGAVLLLWEDFSWDEVSGQLSGLGTSDRKHLQKSVEASGFNGKQEQVAGVSLPESGMYVVCSGMGKREKLHLNSVRLGIAYAVRHAVDAGIKSIAVPSEPFSGIKKEDAVRAVAETVVMSLYRFDRFKSERKEPELKLVAVTDADSRLSEHLEIGKLLGEMNIKTRELVNTPAETATPQYVSNIAKNVAKRFNLSFEMFDRKLLEKMGMHGIISVGKGSVNQPCMAVLEYRPKKSRKTVALVGKGVCFDSGGLSIKPADSMETMKDDKSGASAVIYTMEAVARLRPDINVIGILPLVENAVSSESYKPGDIIRTASGKSVEILNTDAEGRLILADALHYAGGKKPDLIINVATLTGACVIALGNDIAGILGNDQNSINQLISAGSYTYERLWQLPLVEEYNDLIKSDFADVKNVIGNQRYNPAGTIVGALFLSNFVKGNWAHIDIAGTSWAETEKGYYSRGATGFGTRLLTEFLLKMR